MLSNSTAPGRRRLDLPFVKRRRDVVSRIYRHRAGIFSVLVLTLLMAVLFIGSRIVVRTPEPENAILVDLQTVEELREELRRLERENLIRREFGAGEPVSNAISNAGAEFSDTRNSNMSAELQGAGEAAGRMNANRAAWEQGMREIDAIGSDRGNAGNNSNDKGGNSRAKGRVLVEFSLTRPLRRAENIPPPGYRCEREGEVVVNITVSRGGDVVSAVVDRAASTNDVCMHETAVEYALRSHFNIESAAPERHTGTITYTFVAQ